MNYPDNDSLRKIYSDVEDLTGLSREHAMEVADLVIDVVLETCSVEDDY